MSRARSAADWPDEPQAWARAAVLDCLELGRRLGPRLARHCRRQQRCRDPADDALTLAARRLLPLPRRVLRPLPAATLSHCARAFNALDPADRRALLGWRTCPAFQPQMVAEADAGRQVQGARAEHLASALARLVHDMQALAWKTHAQQPVPRAGTANKTPPATAG